MKLKIIFSVIVLFLSHSSAQILLTPSEVAGSPNKYDGKFIGMIGTVKNLAVFINGNGERAMKFLLSDDNGNSITVRLSKEEPWMTESEQVNASGMFYKNYGLGLENNLLMINLGNYGESIIPYEEDKTIKLLDGLLRKLIK